MPKMKLSKRVIDGLEPPSKGDLVVWDATLSGFGVRVKPTGRKTYFIQYRNVQGRTRKMKIGLVGRMTPDEARSSARMRLVDVEQGKDPAELRSSTGNLPNVAELADRYMAEHAQVMKKPESIRSDRQSLRNVILPELGQRRVDDVNQSDVTKLLYRHRV